MDDRRILDAFPLPLARGFRRWLNAREARDHRVNAALKGLARPSLGEWVRFLRECLRLVSRGHDSPTGALATLFSERTERWDEPLSLFNDIRVLLQSATGRKETLSLEM